MSRNLSWTGGTRTKRTCVYSFMGMSEICTIMSFCQKHSGQSLTLCLLFGAVKQLKWYETQSVCIIDSHGFIFGSDVMPNRLVSMGRLAGLRVGCFGVLRFGTLVSESIIFVTQACLAPLGCCAAVVTSDGSSWSRKRDCSRSATRRSKSDEVAGDKGTIRTSEFVLVLAPKIAVKESP